MMTWIYSISAFLIAWGMARLLLPAIIRLARRYRLYDQPNERKVHTTPVSSLGGIALFMACWGGVALLSDATTAGEWKWIFAGALLMFGTGLADDLLDLPAWQRLIIQWFAASCLYFGGWQVQWLEGLLHMGVIPDIVEYGISVFIVMLLVNAWNLIDGVNGLAGSLALLACTIYGGLFLIIGATTEALIALGMAGALLAFLSFNFGYRARIFMGDNGATVIGFSMAAFAMRLCNLDLSAYHWHLSHSIILAMCLQLIPVIDLVKVATLRVLQGRSPFHADKTHIHHLLLELGMSHPGIAVLLTGYTGLVFICTFTALLYLPAEGVLPLLLAFGLAPYVAIAWRKKAIPAHARHRYQRRPHVWAAGEREWPLVVKGEE